VERAAVQRAENACEQRQTRSPSPDSGTDSSVGGTGVRRIAPISGNTTRSGADRKLHLARWTPAVRPRTRHSRRLRRGRAHRLAGFSLPVTCPRMRPDASIRW